MMAAQPRTQKTPSDGRPRSGKHLQMFGHNSNINTHSPECSPPCWLPNPHQVDSQHYPCDPHHHFLLPLLLPLFLPSDSVSHRGLLFPTMPLPSVAPWWLQTQAEVLSKTQALPSLLTFLLPSINGALPSTARLYLKIFEYSKRCVPYQVARRNVWLVLMSNCRQHTPYFLDNLYIMNF